MIMLDSFVEKRLKNEDRNSTAKLKHSCNLAQKGNIHMENEQKTSSGHHSYCFHLAYILYERTDSDRLYKRDLQRRQNKRSSLLK